MKEILKIRFYFYFYFNEESDYSEENTSDNAFSTISVWAWTENMCGNESHEKETKHMNTSVANLSDIRIGNLDWCKCRHFKNEAGAIDYLCCREVDAMLIASAKISEHQGSILPSSFYGHLPNY